MKKVTLILAIVFIFILSSCGDNAKSEDSSKSKTSEVETLKTENVKVKKETNIYVKDIYEKYLGIKATKNIFSQKDWDQILKVCAAYKVLKNTTDVNKMTEAEWGDFFKKQGYADFATGKDDILRFKKLYKVSTSIPSQVGSLSGIKKLYGEEQYEKSCAETGDIYNELNLSFEDLKNIEKYSIVIGDAYLINMNF